MNKLIYKFLHKSLSTEEFRQLKRWLNTTSEGEIGEELSTQWENHTIEEPRNWIAYHAISGKLQPLLRNPPKSHRLPLGHYLSRIVATLLFPLLVAGGVYYFTKQHEYKIYATTQYRMETGKGERATLVLPDGTKVSLNSESIFTYPASFGKTDRNVHLEGEAYFVVTHDETLPFQVQTKQTNVKVLGTTFNIHAYPTENWIETALVEGKVEFYETTHPSNRVILAPDQTARFNISTGIFERNTIEQRLATAWKRGEIIFRSASWPFIIDQISKYYGVTIQQEGQTVPLEQFTGSFLHEDVNVVLRNLQVHYHFTYTKTGNTIKIKFSENTRD